MIATVTPKTVVRTMSTYIVRNADRAPTMTPAHPSLLVAVLRALSSIAS